MYGQRTQKANIYKGNKMKAFDLRGNNPILGKKGFAYRITPMGYVRLQDAFDIHNTLNLRYDILITEVKGAGLTYATSKKV